MKSPPRNRRSAASASRARSNTAPVGSAHARVASHADLVHELEVHQVELEMQNEQLRHAQIDLAAARDRFIDLYDFAPVGYFTLDVHGMVIEANLTVAAMLGIDRKAMLGRGFSRSVVPAHAALWHRHMRQAMLQQGTKRVELVLQHASGSTIHGRLDCALYAPQGQLAGLRVTLTDITQQKMAEMDRRIADTAMDAREAERRHVARELHEGLGQRLSALKMELGSLQMASDTHSTRERIATMLDTLDSAFASVRRIAIDLRPLMLDDLGLAAALDWLVRDTGRRLGLDITPHLQEIDPAPDERTSIATYRMAQDMLDHVAHRTKSTKVSVWLQQLAGELILSVACHGDRRHGSAANESDGDENDCAPDSELLQKLDNRVRKLGGRLVVGDKAGLGKSISVRMPLAPMGAAQERERYAQ